MQKKTEFTPEQLHFLRLLGKQYPTVQAAGAEIINLQAIMNLPKGTEHFISDIHGEYEAFLHLLNSCSGVIRENLCLQVIFLFQMRQFQQRRLADELICGSINLRHSNSPLSRYFHISPLTQIYTVSCDIETFHTVSLHPPRFFLYYQLGMLVV